MSGQLSYGAVVARLIHLLEDIAGDSLDGPITAAGPGSIRQLGLASVQLLQLLIEIENCFGVVWDDDLDESVISSVGAMALHIISVTSDSVSDSAVISEAADE
jgi:acyl carrier protein